MGHAGCMRRKGRVLLAALLAAVVGGLGWLIMRPPERLFQGKPERVWINSLARYSENDFPQWQGLGSDAVPILIKALRKGTGLLDRAYAKAWTHLPSAVAPTVARSLPHPDESIEVRVNAAIILGRLGINAKLSAPALASALRDENIAVHIAAIIGLENLLHSTSVKSHEKAGIVRILIKTMQDNQDSMRSLVISVLGKYKAQPELVVPVLISALNDSDASVRNRAALALAQVDSPASAKPDPTVMTRCLIEGLHFKLAGPKVQSARALGSLGPAARKAIPDLKQALEDENGEVRSAAALAIQQIDPAPAE